MQRLVAQKLPHGPILVPACGPGKCLMITLFQYSLPSITHFVSSGHELVMLANAFSDGRHIIGIDLAEGMVDLANSRCKEAGIRFVPHEVQLAVNCIENSSLVRLHLTC